MIPFEVFVFAMAAAGAAAIVAAVVVRPREPEVVHLSGPPCPATVRLHANATEFEAAIEVKGPLQDDPFVRAALERLSPAKLTLAPSRLLLSVGRRLEGDEHPRFVAVAYSIVQRAMDISPPV